MSTSVVDAAPLAHAHAEVDELLGAPLDLWSSDELMDAWREVERLRNRLAAVENRFVAAAEARHLPAEFEAKNTAAFLRGLLRVDAYDASARVRAADAAVGRTTLTGEPTPAPFAQVSAAQVSRAISPRHAGVVVKAVERLSDELQVSHGLQVETELTELAGQFDPAELAKLGHRMTMLLDQDGALADVAYRERKREFTVHQRADGSSTVSGEATAELTERLLTMFHALAAPKKPAADGVQDARTAAQRRHDALNDALDLVQRAELLPDAGGVTTTVLLTTRWKATPATASPSAKSATMGRAVLVPPDQAREAVVGQASELRRARHIKPDEVEDDSSDQRCPPDRSPPRLRRTPGLVPSRPHRRPRQRRTHHHQQRHAALRPPRSELRETGLETHQPRRPTRLDPPTLDRPPPDTTAKSETAPMRYSGLPSLGVAQESGSPKSR